jgi:hypothetical protein
MGTLVPKVGFEPTRALAHTALNRARLPVSPLRQLPHNIKTERCKVKVFILLHEVILIAFHTPNQFTCCTW